MLKGNEPTVLIAIPHGGWIRAELLDLVPYWERNFDAKHITPEGYKPGSYARNFCVDEFLKTGFDYLWFIDHDTRPPPHALEAFLNAEKQAISGIVRTWKLDVDGLMKPVPMVARKENGEYWPVLDGSGIEQIDVCGAACLFLHKSVFEKVPRLWFEERNYGGEGNHDFKFCEKLAVAGIPLFAQFSVICAHKKESDV